MPSLLPPTPFRRRAACSRYRLPLASCLLLAACGEQVGTPLPEPPALSPIDPSDLSLPKSEVSILVDHIAVVGAAGTLDAGVRVLVTNLNTGARMSGTVEREGSFRVDLPAVSGDALRVEVDTDAGRTPPTDLEYTGEAIVPLTIPACIRRIPETFVDVTESAFVGVQNDCAEPLAVRDVILLIDDGSFSMARDASDSIPPGGEFLVEVRPLAPRRDGDVLRFDVERNARLRMVAVSLRRP